MRMLRNSRGMSQKELGIAYYEMSLENQREYVYQNDFTVAENALGVWLIVFLDVDWDGLIQKTESLRKDHEGTLPKFKLMQEKQRRQWELAYSERVAAWYRRLKAELSKQHPLLKLLVERQIRNLLVCVSQPENRTELRMEVLRYLEILDGTRAHSEQTVLSPMVLRPWLLEAKQIFSTLKTCREQLLPRLDQVMGGDPEKDGGILQRYHQMQQKDLSFQCMVKQRYRLLSPQFRITSARRLYRSDLPKETAPQMNQLEGHTYMVTDALDALTLWEFEMVCANKISLRRCAYCNRYFRPYSVVSCYCDRPVEGKGGKTCKEIGAMSRHQQKVNQDEAKKLYRKVCNRTQMAAQRRIEQHPDILRRYKQVQLHGKELLEKVAAGTMTLSEFQEQFDKKPRELLGVK